MPLSRVEIQRRHREKKKRLMGEDYLRAERERKRKYYIPVDELSEQDLKKRRSQTLKRVNKSNDKKTTLKAINTSPVRTTRSNDSPATLKIRLSFSNRNKAAGVRKRNKTALRSAYRTIQELESKKRFTYQRKEQVC